MKKKKWPVKKLPDNNSSSGKQFYNRVLRTRTSTKSGSSKDASQSLATKIIFIPRAIEIWPHLNQIFRVLGASTKIIDKWDEMAYLRDVTIALKDQEVEESRKLLKETKQRQTQLGIAFELKTGFNDVGDIVILMT